MVCTIHMAVKGLNWCAVDLAVKGLNCNPPGSEGVKLVWALHLAVEGVKLHSTWQWKGLNCNPLGSGRG